MMPNLPDEEDRLKDHPGIVFRDGPAGRRAGLLSGPDVWEVVGGFRASGDQADLEELSEDLGLTRVQVKAAFEYYDEFPVEIDEWIRHNREEADAYQALFKAEKQTDLP
jgi:hypothetical protein